jgi:hypothetical protein
MCNRRSATLPAMVAALPDDTPLGFWLARSGMDHPFRTLLNELFVDPIVRRLPSRRPRPLDTSAQEAAPLPWVPANRPGAVRRTTSGHPPSV